MEIQKTRKELFEILRRQNSDDHFDSGPLYSVLDDSVFLGSEVTPSTERIPTFRMNVFPSSSRDSRLMGGNRNKLIWNVGNRLLTNTVSHPVRTETSGWCCTRWADWTGLQNRSQELHRTPKNLQTSDQRKLIREVTHMQRRHTQGS
jgi:hypothetical protein